MTELESTYLHTIDDKLDATYVLYCVDFSIIS